jgi:putative oxidoreductase
MGKCDKWVKKYSGQMYFVFRVLIGFMFFMHGAQKFGLWGDMSVSGFAAAMSLPVWVAGLVALGELLAGLGIALGFYTRLSALGGIIIMIGALVLAHFPQGINPLTNGGELAVMYLASFLVLKVHGAGKVSLEKAMLETETF